MIWNFSGLLDYVVSFMKHLLLFQGTQVHLMDHILRNAAPGRWKLLSRVFNFHQRFLLRQSSLQGCRSLIVLFSIYTFHIYMTCLFEQLLANFND